jgi:hypothetical protein
VGQDGKTAVNVALRIYVLNKLELEERIHVSEQDLETLLPQMAERHAEMIGARKHMVEIEFLDEPDQTQRFFRFGTDPSGMIIPLAFDVTKLQ